MTLGRFRRHGRFELDSQKRRLIAFIPGSAPAALGASINRSPQRAAGDEGDRINGFCQMPSRILREGILTSERVNSLSPHAELFYRRLMSVVDDFGRFSAHPALLRAACYPLRVDEVREADISRWLSSVESAGLILLYAVNSKRFLEMIDFRQQVRAKESKFPAPHTLSECESITHPSRSEREANVLGVGDEGAVEDGVEDEDERDRAPPPKFSRNGQFAEEFLAFWNATVPFSKARRLKGPRLVSLYARQKDEDFVAHWREAILKIPDSPFLRGENDRGWKANVEWFLRPETLTKILEGNYDSRKGVQTKFQTGSGQVFDPNGGKDDPNFGKL